MDDSIVELISQYTSKDICPFHMPGHKRNIDMLGNKLPYNLDITEIHGFDNLHDPQGILKNCADTACKLYGSKKTFLLVSGSTVGILAGIRAVTSYGDCIIMARNCHKSVYNAVEVNGLQTHYLVPKIDSKIGINCSITPLEVEAALEQNPNAKLVVITSPTYEGVISDIKGIADVVHKKGIPLLVDEAHGAHLGFSDAFSGEALKNGADIVITSLHKTLPTLTGCALAHVGGELVDPDKIARQLDIFETSSPSYVLMSSIDYCIRLLTNDKDRLFSEYESNLNFFYEGIKRLKKLSVLSHDNNFFAYDIGKIVISTKGTTLTGVALAEILRSQYKIELEMAYTDYAVAMTSICDTKESFARLANALVEIDTKIEISGTTSEICPYVTPLQKLTISEVQNYTGESVLLENAVGLISLEYVWAYPPGIPLITPGEVIDEQILNQVKTLVLSGVQPKSTNGKMPKYITATHIDKL